MISVPFPFSLDGSGGQWSLESYSLAICSLAVYSSSVASARGKRSRARLAVAETRAGERVRVFYGGDARII